MGLELRLGLGLGLMSMGQNLQLFTTPKGEHLGYILCSTKKGRTRLACDILFEKDVNALLFIVAKNSL